MDPSVTDSDPREARMLAAIVFTDVVGFSKLAAKNEARVYVALQRDMSVMTNLCRAHGGQVLNTMGDGMLLCFTSAVDALGCAVEIQRTLHNQSLTLPDIEILQHRIGVHLGDVIMNGDNVFGDGVNVASRLQTLAAPGAVCYSNTVHEVVKNKLKIDAKYLGPRQLKNIGEPVRVWQVPPLGNARSESADVGPSIVESHGSEGQTGARGLKAGLMVLASVLLLALLIFAFTRMKPAPNAWDSLPTKPRKDTTGTATGSDPNPPITSAKGIGPSPGGTDTPEQIRQQIRDLKSKYKFNDIVVILDREGDRAPDEQAKLKTYQNLRDLDSFVQQALNGANPANPLPVPQMDVGVATPLAAQVYMQNQQVVIQTAVGQPHLNWEQITPTQYMEIATAAINSSPSPTTPASQLSTYAQQFGDEFGVSVPG